MAPLLASADQTLMLIGKLSIDIGQRLDVFERTARSAELVGQAAATFEAGALPRINALLETADRSVRTFERVAERLGDEPTSVLFGPQPGRPGPGEPGFVPPSGITR